MRLNLFCACSRAARRAGPIVVLIATLVLRAPTPAFANSQPPTAPATPAASGVLSVSDYRAKLQSLDQLLAACQQAMTPDHCESSQVGPDLRLSLPSGTRQIRLAWLRQLLDNAAQDAASKKSPAPTAPANAKSVEHPEPGPGLAPILHPALQFQPPALATQLEDARKRLAAEQAMFGQSSSTADHERTPASPDRSPTPQRQVLTRILAGEEYQTAAAGPSLIQQIEEKIGNSINRFLARLIRAGSRSKWIGLTAEITFVILLCLALAWFLIRLERQGRLGPIRIGPEPGSGAASVRDWQLWLEDARKAAAQGAWREAIHLLYWASISRLESSGLWPADRARTPREYLALLTRESLQRPSLAALTRTFERAWYAGRPVAEADYRQAEQLAFQLGAGNRGTPGAR